MIFWNIWSNIKWTRLRNVFLNATIYHCFQILNKNIQYFSLIVWNFLLSQLFNVIINWFQILYSTWKINCDFFLNKFFYFDHHHITATFYNINWIPWFLLFKSREVKYILPTILFNISVKKKLKIFCSEKHNVISQF